MSKKRTRQDSREVEEDIELEEEDVENVSPSATKRTPTPPDLENGKLRTPLEKLVEVKLTPENYVTGNVSYRSSKQEISSDSEEDDDDAIDVAVDDDDDDDDDDGITVIIDSPVAWNPETNADAVLRERRLASSPKFNLEGILQMYEDLVLYDFK